MGSIDHRLLCMQRLIFDKPCDGVRKIILATNIAETSITIDDVVYVIDCGKAKETSYDALNNTPCLLPSWISKASAHQVIFSSFGGFVLRVFTHVVQNQVALSRLLTYYHVPLEKRKSWASPTWRMLPHVP